MSRDGRQRQRERERDTDSGSDRDTTGGSSGGRATVSNRTSWSGLAKRAYNVAFGSRSGRSRSDDGSSLKLAGLTLVGAFAAGLLPLPLTWLLGVGVGAAAGGWTDNGSALSAVGIGGIVGFLAGVRARVLRTRVPVHARVDRCECGRRRRWLPVRGVIERHLG